MTYTFAGNEVIVFGNQTTSLWSEEFGFCQMTQGGAVARMSALSAWEIVNDPDHSVPTKEDARYHARYHHNLP